MINRIHNSDFFNEWPPDSAFPSQTDDLEALFQVTLAAWKAYFEAAQKWERTKEQERLAAWKTYHEQAGWPRDESYKEKLEAKLAAYEPKAVEEPIVEPIVEP